MLIIWGSSPKQQILGQRNEPCAACRQETPHTLVRNYRVKHLFWFPLFSTGTRIAKICERCKLDTTVDPPPPRTVSAPPGCTGSDSSSRSGSCWSRFCWRRLRS